MSTDASVGLRIHACATCGSPPLSRTDCLLLLAAAAAVATVATAADCVADIFVDRLFPENAQRLSVKQRSRGRAGGARFSSLRVGAT